MNDKSLSCPPICLGTIGGGVLPSSVLREEMAGWPRGGSEKELVGVSVVLNVQLMLIFI